MWIQGEVTYCDIDQTSYEKPVMGAHAICRGASGRYCAVLWAGPEAVERDGLEPITREEALKIIEEKGDGWAEF